MGGTWKALYVGLIANLATAAVLNNPVMPSAKVWLVTLGASNELLGVLLVASPELEPRIISLRGFLGRWGRHLARSIETKLRALLRLPPRPSILESGVSRGTATVGASMETPYAILGKTVEERLTFLEEQVRRHARRLDEVTHRVDAFRDDILRELEQAKEELRDELAELERRLADRQIHLRLLGLGYVVLGIVLAWLGNIV